MSSSQIYQLVLDFWFKESEPQKWFKKDLSFDREIASRFSKIHRQACAGELAMWRSNAHGRLAEIIVLDQFSRNLFRDHAQAFATDSLALVLAQEAIAGGHDKELSVVERGFIYMPFMHSESKIIHQEALRIFTEHGQSGNLDYEIKHKAIIDRFGRYPHRNSVMGRKSTDEELAFLQEPGSSF